MDARRARILAGSAFAAGLLAASWVAPAAAADCALTAPATVDVGAQLTIEGAGFPASSSVDITLTIEGGASDELTVQSTASGAFQISLTPEEVDAGKTTVVATAGSACSAQVVFTVLGANQTAPPTTEPEGSAGGAGALLRRGGSPVPDLRSAPDHREHRRGAGPAGGRDDRKGG